MHFFNPRSPARTLRITRANRPACLLASLWLLISPAQAAQKVTVGHIGVNESANAIVAETFIAQLGKRLPGKFNIAEKGGSTLGGEADIWEALKLGTVDFAVLTAGSITREVPQLGVLSVPFLFRDTSHAAHVLNGPIGKTLGASMNSPEVVFLAFGEHGFRHMSNSKRPVTRPSDLAGLRIRVIPNPVYELTFKTLGAEVVPMPFPAVYGALDDGRIDGQENPLLTFSGSHFERVQKYLSLTGHFYSAMVIIVSGHTYKNLKPAERRAIVEAADAAALQSRPLVVAQDRSIVANLRLQGVMITEVERSAFVKTLQPLAAEWEKRFGAELLKRISDTQ